MSSSPTASPQPAEVAKEEEEDEQQQQQDPISPASPAPASPLSAAGDAAAAAAAAESPLSEKQQPQQSASSPAQRLPVPQLAPQQQEDSSGGSLPTTPAAAASAAPANAAESLDAPALQALVGRLREALATREQQIERQAQEAAQAAEVLAALQRRNEELAQSKDGEAVADLQRCEGGRAGGRVVWSVGLLACVRLASWQQAHACAFYCFRWPPLLGTRLLVCRCLFTLMLLQRVRDQAGGS